MFRKQYKKDFAPIKADSHFINNMAQGLKKGPAKRSGLKSRFIVAAAAALCLFLGWGLMAGGLNKPVFTTVAFANENSSKWVNIEEEAQVILPFGKISRGEKNTYLDETGRAITNYDAGFLDGGISVKGENIATVDYTSQAGELRYHDAVISRQMEEAGEIKVCEFTVPQEIIPTGKDMYASFKKLWNSGYFDQIKDEYFQDKECDIDKYQVMFGQDMEQAKKGIWHVEISNKFENGYPFIQCGKNITATFYEELGEGSLAVHWIPWEAINLVSEDKPINFADLPQDIITITVHFTSGKILTKQLKLSFNRDGYLIGEIASW